jgi:hypothetical protein
MAKKNKTQPTGINIADFIDSFVESEQMKTESYRLMDLMKQWSGLEPYMWGPSIIGYGTYHYKYASGHEGDAPILGFSPRKAAFSLYIYSPTDYSKQLLTELGKFKMGKACIYVKKLADVNLEIMQKLCDESVKYIQTHHTCGCQDES